MSSLRRAAGVALVTHLIAGLGMAFVLRHGLETTPSIEARLSFLVDHRVMWIFAWLAWTAAALSILYFYSSFAQAHRLSHFAVHLTIAALASDFGAQAIEIGVLPAIARDALRTSGNPETFLMVHRVAVMLSGYLANGLYSVSALALAWPVRAAYPAWVTVFGLATGVAGIALSVAALVDSASGMYWTNVCLVPVILTWLVGVALVKPRPRP